MSAFVALNIVKLSFLALGVELLIAAAPVSRALLSGHVKPRLYRYAFKGHPALQVPLRSLNSGAVAEKCLRCNACAITHREIHIGHAQQSGRLPGPREG